MDYSDTAYDDIDTYSPISGDSPDNYATDGKSGSDDLSNEAGSEKYTPILPFNDLAQDNFIIYNNVTYRRDVALTECGIMKHNPNMIKYYTTQNVEPIRLGGD